MSIKVDIFSGFLGAGKTMLIKKLIKDGYYKENIAIIENEFGEVSIDGQVLKESNVKIKEINSGCICCQVTGDFKEALYEVVKDYNIERLIIEPTGIAKLSDIVKVFNGKGLENYYIDNLITVVDAERFFVYLKNFRKFFIDQIKTAEVIVLSRTQLVNVSYLFKVKEEIRKLNPKAKVVDQSWLEVNGCKLMEGKEEKRDTIRTTASKASIVRSQTVGTAVLRENPEPVFESYALSIEKTLSKEEIKSKFNFIANNKLFGKIVRAKGFVELNNGEKGQVNFTLNECIIEPVKYEGQSIISFIGTNLNRNEIRKFFI